MVKAVGLHEFELRSVTVTLNGEERTLCAIYDLTEGHWVAFMAGDHWAARQTAEVIVQTGPLLSLAFRLRGIFKAAARRLGKAALPMEAGLLDQLLADVTDGVNRHRRPKDAPLKPEWVDPEKDA